MDLMKVKAALAAMRERGRRVRTIKAVSCYEGPAAEMQAREEATTAVLGSDFPRLLAAVEAYVAWKEAVGPWHAAWTTYCRVKTDEAAAAHEVTRRTTNEATAALDAALAKLVES